MDVGSYQEELAWDLARSHVQKAQRRQRKKYNRNVMGVSICVGERVFLFVASAKQGKAHKFSMIMQPIFAQLTDPNKIYTIRVSLNRLRKCPNKIRNTEESDFTTITENDTPAGATAEQVSSDGLSEKILGDPEQLSEENTSTSREVDLPDEDVSAQSTEDHPNFSDHVGKRSMLMMHPFMQCAV